MMPFLVFLALLGTGLAGVTLVQHYRHELALISLRDARRLAEVPETPLAEVRDGALVKLVGAVAADESVISYFDRVPCVARKIEFRSHVGTSLELGWSGVQTVTVTEIQRELRTVPFRVETDGGHVPIDPRQAVFDFEVAGGEEGSNVHEHRIRLGEKVAVVGTVRVRPEGGYRDAPAGPRVQFTGPVLVSWRTEREFLPRTRPPALAVALLAVGVACGAAYATLAAQREARHEAWRQQVRERLSREHRDGP